MMIISKFFNHLTLKLNHFIKLNMISLSLNKHYKYNIYIYLFLFICIICSIIIRSNLITEEIKYIENYNMFMNILILFVITYCIKLIFDILIKFIQLFKFIPKFINLYNININNKYNIILIIILYYIQNVLFITLFIWILYSIFMKLDIFIDNIYIYIIFVGIALSLLFIHYYPLNEFNVNFNIKQYPLWVYFLLIFLIIFNIFILPLIVIKILHSNIFINFKNIFLDKCVKYIDPNYMDNNPNRNTHNRNKNKYTSNRNISTNIPISSNVQGNNANTSNTVSIPTSKNIVLIDNNVNRNNTITVVPTTTFNSGVSTVNIQNQSFNNGINNRLNNQQLQPLLSQSSSSMNLNNRQFPSTNSQYPSTSNINNSNVYQTIKFKKHFTIESYKNIESKQNITTIPKDRNRIFNKTMLMNKDVITTKLPEESLDNNSNNLSLISNNLHGKSKTSLTITNNNEDQLNLNVLDIDTNTTNKGKNKESLSVDLIDKISQVFTKNKKFDINYLLNDNDNTNLNKDKILNKEIINKEILGFNDNNIFKLPISFYEHSSENIRNIINYFNENEKLDEGYKTEYIKFFKNLLYNCDNNKNIQYVLSFLNVDNDILKVTKDELNEISFITSSKLSNNDTMTFVNDTTTKNAYLKQIERIIKKHKEFIQFSIKKDFNLDIYFDLNKNSLQEFYMLNDLDYLCSKYKYYNIINIKLLKQFNEGKHILFNLTNNNINNVVCDYKIYNLCLDYNNNMTYLLSKFNSDTIDIFNNNLNNKNNLDIYEIKEAREILYYNTIFSNKK